jgi:hypothetical protein
MNEKPVDAKRLELPRPLRNANCHAQRITLISWKP